MLAVEETQRL